MDDACQCVIPMVATVNVVSSRACGRVHMRSENIGDDANRHGRSQSDAGPEPGERVKGEPEPGVVISAGTLSFRPRCRLPYAVLPCVPPSCSSICLFLYTGSAGHSTQLYKPLGCIRSQIHLLVYVHPRPESQRLPRLRGLAAHPAPPQAIDHSPPIQSSVRLPRRAASYHPRRPRPRS